VARSPAASARLEAASAAKRLHRALDLEQRTVESEGAIDVYDAIAELDIELLFKPLEKALGLCLPAPFRGILVTSKRGLHIQRFTAAHELGHIILEHSGSVDVEIGERGQFTSTQGRDLKEVAADAFASEFLLPRWLYRHHVQAQGWRIDDLRNPDVVYQLSLRMAASYDATCWGLLGHQILDRPAVEILRRETVARIKQATGQDHRPENSWANVWKVTSRDAGKTLVGDPQDVIRLDLAESPATGFAWSAEELAGSDLEVLSDTTAFARDPVRYGATSVRTVVARSINAGSRPLVIHERQPWRTPSADDARFEVSLALHGNERGGRSRADRSRRKATP
jgi:Zn-dependent peptidase ImmA (M78 family)